MEDQYPRYSLALLGDFSADTADAIESVIAEKIEALGLEFGEDVTLYRGSARGFNPRIDRCCAALCARIDPSDEGVIERLMYREVPIIPVARTRESFAAEFPGDLGVLNGLPLTDGPALLAHSLLEASSLVPRQRRVFLSYRRIESTEAALQLYAALCARQYEVFLDTHGILPGEHFQEVLWQRLSDSDVLVYLDTPGYFESRWTDLEFNKASLRNIGMLRVGWPKVAPRHTRLISGEVQLAEADFLENGNIGDSALATILNTIEFCRTKSVAQRYADIIHKVTCSVEAAGGRIIGRSSRRGLVVSIRDQVIVVYPELRVPTSESLYEATLEDHLPPVAVVYNEEGIEERKWVAHMSWLTARVKKHVRLVKANASGNTLLDW